MDQEVRRAEPVHPEDLKKAQAAQAAAATPTPSPSPERKSFRGAAGAQDLRPRGGGRRHGASERWVNPSEGLQFRGRRIAIKVLDPSDVEIRKNGKLVAGSDVDVRLE